MAVARAVDGGQWVCGTGQSWMGRWVRGLRGAWAGHWEVRISLNPVGIVSHSCPLILSMLLRGAFTLDLVAWRLQPPVGTGRG